MYVPNDCSATGHLPFLVWGGVQATTGELRPQNGLPVRRTLVQQILWPLSMYSGRGMYSQATPRLLNTCVTGYNEFARNQMSVSRSLTVVSVHSLGLED